MRSSLTVILALSASAIASAAVALEASDSMAVWKKASAADKSRLVAAILARDGGGERASIIKCLDSAADIPGHADLPIAEIAKVCEKADSQPV